MNFKQVTAWLSIPGGILALFALWSTLGLPRPATSADIERLSRQQAQQAVELYNNKVRSLLSLPAPQQEPNKSVWQEELEKARREQKAAEDQWLKLK